MELQLRTRRWLAAGVATLAGSATLMVMMPASAQSVEPEPVEGNPTCAQVAPGTTSFKVEPVTSGEHSDGTLTVDITVNDTPDGPTFDWTSNIAVQTVIVKGGPNANVYNYGSAGSTGDTGLHAPVNPENDMYYGLSHVDFCYKPTTPPTSAPPTSAPPTSAPPATQPAPPAPTPPAAAPPVPVRSQPTFTG